MIASAPYYWLVCDEPDCGRISTEGAEITAWNDVEGAVWDAEDGDWQVNDDGKHYCVNHRKDGGE